MELSSAIIEIPVEILQVDLKVQSDDPLSKVFEIAKSSQSNESSSPSLLRLEALSRSSHSSVSGKGDFSIPIIRDLWRGEYWKMSEISSSLDAARTGSVVPVESQVPRISEATAKDEVADIANPIKGYLAHHSRVPWNQILSRTRLEGISSEEEVVHLRARVVLRQDRAGRKYWIWDEGPLQKLIANHIEDLSGFEMQETELTESIQSWPLSPEIKALKRLKKNRNEKQALEILDSIHDQINQDNRPRLNWAKQVVGFRQDMWDALQEVVRSSKERVFILTSFSNPQFSDGVADLLAEATEDEIPEIMLSFGEPDRGRSPEDIQNTEQYISTLSKDNRFKLKGGISPRSSHAKVAISDTGMAFICSCNLFSGSLESGILESGLLIKDIHCAKSIIEAVKEEEWVPDEIGKDLEKMHSKLGKMKRPNWTLRNVEGKITEIKNDIRNGNPWYAFPKLERLLRDIAEKPVWSLIRTMEHRPFMADCIERFDKRIVMASDGLRSNGLDKATIHRIDQRASKSGATVHIWWGRHAPKSKPFDKADKRGREEAKDRLNQLRILRNKEKKWNLFPFSSVQPMETHAKAFIVDDSRLMITSDNTLSFGDTESERGDAGELGIMIDHPRLAIQTRGSMELWLSKDARIPGDLVRWWALLGEEVSFVTNKPRQKIPLTNAFDSVIERIESNDYLRSAWEQEIEFNSNEIEIVNKLVLGTGFGVYCIAKSSKARGIKTKLSLNQIDNAVISLGWNSWWQNSN